MRKQTGDIIYNYHKKIIYFTLKLTILIFAILNFSNVFAENVTVNLVVNYKTVNFTGKNIQAIAVNNQIPAPTLHFKQGDTVTINVFNHLHTDTAIHWHGLIVPWQMDGVEHITQKPIPPGGVFQYHFKLYQSGTYWYHAHSGLEEQQGLYGAFIIDPPKAPLYKYNKDYVIVLSDWSNTNPDQILANLKKDGDYYAPRFPLQSSLMHFIQDYRNRSDNERKQLIADYQMMQNMRMNIYDFSDVAYDAFLLNGRPASHPWTALVKPGDSVRLRFIGATGSSIYRVKIPGTTMQIVHVEGNDVKPFDVNDFSIAPGETYDVLVKIKKNAPYIIYAESLDTLGAAIGSLVTYPNQPVNYQQIPPFPEPQPVTREMMTNMMSGMSKMEQNNNTVMPMSDNMQMSMTTMNNKATMNMNMDMNNQKTMNMPLEPTIIGDSFSPANSSSIITTGSKYQNLIAAVKTNDPNKPIANIIKMELFGYMDHYIWMINGKTESQAKPIIIEPGKRYRFIFINNSMMHHPMHLHGHWFILRNGHGAYDPLLHTIDIAPGATVVADVDTDDSGQWFFHCHFLYHMMSGMARVFQYSTIIDIVKNKTQPQSFVQEQTYINRPIIKEDEITPIDPMMINHAMGHPDGFYYSSFLEVGEDPFDNTQRITFKGLYGSDYDKLEIYSNDDEINKGYIEDADTDIFYWHLINQYWAIKGGVNYTYAPAITPYWQPGIGIEGLMPYFIDTDIRTYYHDGSTRLDAELSRDTQITNNIFIRTGIRSILATNTSINDEVGSGLNQMRYIIRPYYRLMPGVDIFTEFEHTSDYGAFKDIMKNIDEPTAENTLTFGVSFLF